MLLSYLQCCFFLQSCNDNLLKNNQGVKSGTALKNLGEKSWEIKGSSKEWLQ